MLDVQFNSNLFIICLNKILNSRHSQLNGTDQNIGGGGGGLIYETEIAVRKWPIYLYTRVLFHETDHILKRYNITIKHAS